MGWFRANRTFGGRLALLALVVQFVVAFGHIHRDDLYGPAGAVASAAVPAPDSQSPPAGHPAKPGDDYCAICATLALLNNSLAAAAPLLPLPPVWRAVEPIEHGAAAVIALRRAPFQSRAPPAA